MQIKCIKINCYKSIKEPLILASVSDLTILIGQNNSGKSNILDAIEFALKSPDIGRLFYVKADIELELVFSENEQKRWQLPAGEGIFVLQRGLRELRFGKIILPYNKSLQDMFSVCVKRLNADSFDEFKNIEHDWHTLFAYPGFLEKFRFSLKNHFPKILADKNALDINYENEGLYEGDRRATIDRLGSGFRRIFTMLLYIFHPDYSIVLIDEPETHLHPALIKKLLISMLNAQAGQIFFTTHSPLFVKPMTLPNIKRVVKENNTTKIFGINKAKYDTRRLISELNADNLEMFFADKVLMVEGVSDRLLFRGLIDKFYKGDKDIKVIQAHGKGNIKLYLELLNIFKIPFTVVLDKDALKTSFLQDLLFYLEIKLPPLSDNDLIEYLKRYGIFILNNGALEANYPKKFQNEESKSLNALRAANQIDEADFDSSTMANLKEIVLSL